MKITWAVMLTMGVLSGCASMSVEQCTTANWERIGEEDGARGNANRLASHYKACESANVTPNQSQYELGHQRGLQQYCTAQNIFSLALQGQGTYQNCPLEQRNELQPYYQTGNQYYQAQQQLKNVEQEVQRLQNLLIDANLTTVQRNNYRNQLDRLRSDLLQKERNFYQAERNLQDLKLRSNLR